MCLYKFILATGFFLFRSLADNVLTLRWYIEAYVYAIGGACGLVIGQVCKARVDLSVN